MTVHRENTLFRTFYFFDPTLSSFWPRDFVIMSKQGLTKPSCKNPPPRHIPASRQHGSLTEYGAACRAVEAICICPESRRADAVVRFSAVTADVNTRASAETRRERA